MRFASHVAHFLLMACLASPAALPDPPKVRLPAGPVVPSPMPNPESPLTLADDTVMVCDSDVEVIVLSSPRGLLRVTAEKGPMRVRGRFVDGTGQVETRTYAGPFLYFIEPVAAGKCELLVIPVGGREADVLRRTIVCQVGPQPPPKPDPKPDPKPIPPDGKLGLVKASRDGAAKVTAPPGDAAKLAKAQRSLASAIAAGALSDPAKILTAWRDGNNAAVDKATWKAWGESVSAALAKLHADGKLPDPEAWAEAFAEIAVGLGG